MQQAFARTYDEQFERQAALPTTPSRRWFSVSNITTEVLLLGLILAALQVMDGVLTAVGVIHLGVHVEGNVIIRTLMEQIGAIPALLIIKGVALAVIVGICGMAAHVKWLTLAMRAIIVIYVGAAVIPWSVVIAKHIL
ncbi:MAG: DUF5658 family protein [Oligoflexia bacterium]|nr:DUF5658 family protein [Oligoflexia bacterium]